MSARRSLLVNPFGLAAGTASSAASRAWLRCSASRSPGMRVPVLVVSGAGDGVQGLGAGDRVVAESLDAQQASVGGEADLPQRGQIGQPFADPEVAGVVDGGFGP